MKRKDTARLCPKPISVYPRPLAPGCGVLENEDVVGLQESHSRNYSTILLTIAVSLATTLWRATEHLSTLSTQAR